MPTSTELYRHSCKRLHRALANYFAIRGWCSGADCLVLQRSALEKMLQLERIKRTRLEWLQEDMAGWFAHIHILRQKNDRVGSLYLSRVNIDRFTEAMMTVRVRTDLMKAAGIKTLAFGVSSKLPKGEAALLTEMNLLAAGLVPAPSETGQR